MIRWLSLVRVLTVTVSDPVKLGEGMHAYISYKINTKTDDPAFDYNSPSTEMPRKCTISKSTLMMRDLASAAHALAYLQHCPAAPDGTLLTPHPLSIPMAAPGFSVVRRYSDFV